MRDNTTHDCVEVHDDSNKLYCIPENLELDFARVIATQDHEQLDKVFSKYLVESS